MGKPTGFLEYERTLPTRRPPQERIKDWKEAPQFTIRAVPLEQEVERLEAYAAGG